MDFDIVCPQCNIQYKQNNPPRSLLCGHSYCNNCLSLMIQKSGQICIIVCPEDKQTTKIKQSVQKLPKNIALLKYIIGKNKINNSNHNSSNSSIKDGSLQGSKITKDKNENEEQDAFDLTDVIKSSQKQIQISQIENQEKSKSTQSLENQENNLKIKQNNEENNLIQQNTVKEKQILQQKQINRQIKKKDNQEQKINQTEQKINCKEKQEQNKEKNVQINQQQQQQSNQNCNKKQQNKQSKITQKINQQKQIAKKQQVIQKTEQKSKTIQTQQIQNKQNLQKQQKQQQILIEVIDKKDLEQQTKVINQKENKQIIPQQQIELKAQKKQQQQQLNKQQKVQQQICLAHRRPIDVVCLNDLHRLCSKCALFGEHKGHEFKGIQQIQRQNKILIKQMINIFDQKASILSQISGNDKLKQITDCIGKKANQLKKQVQDKFKNFMEQLKKCQADSLKKIDQISSEIKQKIQKQLNSDQNVFRQCQVWQLNSLQMIKQAEETHDLNLNFYTNGKKQISEGITKIAMLHQKITTDLLEIHKWIDSFKINFHQSSFKNCLVNLVQILKQQKKQNKFQKQNQNLWSNIQNITYVHHKKQHHDSDQSLLQFDQLQLNSVNNMTTFNSKILDQSFMSVKKQRQTLPPPSSKQKQAQKNLFIPKQKNGIQVSQNNITTNKQVKIQGPAITKDNIKKKLRALKIPDKYQKTIQGIMTDTIDLVDLTNAQLGDTIIYQIAELMKNNTRVKTVKFIRNKLTDQCMIKILPFLKNVSILNIAQNLVTENTLHAILDQRQSLQCLKSIIVSQTKIQQRKSKLLIEKLKKLDLNITL